MANIDTYLQQIMAAIYGEEVRRSIHDAIEAINDQVDTAEETMEQFVQGAMDTTLTSTTKPAEGKAVGDAIKNTKDVLKEEINTISISGDTSNLFDPYSIAIGLNASGATGFPKRAIGNLIYVGNSGAYVKAYNLPVNIKYDVEWYSSDDLSSRVHSSAWISDGSTYHYTGSYPYIALLFARIDNEDLKESDFSGLKIMVNTGNGIKPYQNYLVANDIIARQHAKTALDYIVPFGIIPINGTWENGSDNGSGITYNSKRLTSEQTEITPGSVISFDFFSDDDYRICVNYYDSNGIFISSSNYIQKLSATKKLVSPITAKYIRFTIRHIVNNAEVDIDQADAYNIGIHAEICGDAVNTTDLTVMTYNVGRWHYGVQPFGIPTADYDVKLRNLKRFFAGIDCDIIGLQEWDRVIQYDNNIYSNDVLFDYLLPNSQDTGNWESIKTRYSASYGHIGTFSDGRYYVDQYIQVGNKIIYTLCVHLSPGYGSEYAGIRASEADEILTLLSGHDYCIVFGDFNPDPGEEDTLYQKFENAGYNIANCGWFGKFWTWSSDRNDFDRDPDQPQGNVFYVDNIITSGNIKIVDVKRINVYKDLVSDHIPLVAKLSFRQ